MNPLRPPGAAHTKTLSLAPLNVKGAVRGAKGAGEARGVRALHKALVRGVIKGVIRGGLKGVSAGSVSLALRCRAILLRAKRRRAP
jgi:hypothetical protein